MTRPRPISAIVLAAALLLGGCVTIADLPVIGTRPLTNISLEGSPNQTRIGNFDFHKSKFSVKKGGRVIVAAYRSARCGDPAPSFEGLMRSAAGDGLVVPDGVELYDAGIATVNSGTCGPRSLARAIGVRAYKRGTNQLGFFDSRDTKTVTVK